MFSWQPPLWCAQWCKAVCNPVLVPTLARRWKCRNCCRTLCSTVGIALEFAIDNLQWRGRKIITELVFHVAIILPGTRHDDIYEVTGHDFAIFGALTLLIQISVRIEDESSHGGYSFQQFMRSPPMHRLTSVQKKPPTSKPPQP
jgi:hypothetical protein